MDPVHVIERCVFNPGDIVGGRYTVRKSLGEGSFGAVYQVTDNQGIPYALKLLRLWDVPPSIRQDLHNRFKKEYKTGRIDCQQLVRSLYYDSVKGNPYIIMEYCPGGDLTPLLGKAGVRTVPICRDILLGLNAIHKHDMVHRDLKPENVLFKPDGTAALTDFGIVGDRHERMTQLNIFRKPKQIFGTYAYMPPEQANLVGGGATVKNTTDIFSFGVLAYQLLTNQLPFGQLESHNDVPEYLKKGKEGLWNRDTLRYVDNGRQWVRLFEACLNPNYHDRVQDVNDVLDMLPQYPAERTIHNSAIPQNYVPTPQPCVSTQQGTWLRVINGNQKGYSFNLSALTLQRGRVLVVGRNPDCAIHLTSYEGYVSRYHCTLKQSSDRRHWVLHDGRWHPATQDWSKSSNGTYVNAKTLRGQDYYLQSGDIITLGDITLRFENY